MKKTIIATAVERTRAATVALTFMLTLLGVMGVCFDTFPTWTGSVSDCPGEPGSCMTYKLLDANGHPFYAGCGVTELSGFYCTSNGTKEDFVLWEWKYMCSMYGNSCGSLLPGYPTQTQMSGYRQIAAVCPN